MGMSVTHSDCHVLSSSIDHEDTEHRACNRQLKLELLARAELRSNLGLESEHGPAAGD